MPRCSICKNPVSRSAKACEHCGAVKGYVLGGIPTRMRRMGESHAPIRMIAYGWRMTLVFGVLIPGAIAWWSFQRWDDGLFWRALVILAACPIVLSAYRLIRGPVWFRSDQVGMR